MLVSEICVFKNTQSFNNDYRSEFAVHSKGGEGFGQKKVKSSGLDVSIRSLTNSILKSNNRSKGIDYTI